MIIHRLGSLKNGDNIDYFISCLEHVSHNIEDYSFTRFHKKTTCPQCVEGGQRIYFPHRRALAAQIRGMKDFRKLLIANHALHKFANNCLRNNIKNLEGSDNNLIVNAFDWKNTPEKRDFWEKINNQWIGRLNEKRINSK